ncbi:MAG: hypothetical protein KC550_01590 [Nanoarchaeota archaeon]|nr:hypothetical protein [Nanoarchaeota archaeon]
MFQLEFLELLKKYKNSNDEKKEEIKNSIKKLISENLDEYNKIVAIQDFDKETSEFLKRCEIEIESQTNNLNSNNLNPNNSYNSNFSPEKINNSNNNNNTSNRNQNNYNQNNTNNNSNSNTNQNNYDNNSTNPQAIERNQDAQALKRYYLKWFEIYNNNGKTISKENEAIVLEIINFYIIKRFETLEAFIEIKDSLDFQAFQNHLKNQLRAYFAQKISEYIESNSFKEKGFFDRLKKEKELKKLIKSIDNYKFNKEKIEEVLK